jgi:hypothetical protein
MPQTVYVLTTLQGEGKGQEWRPISVVTNLDIADQWIKEGKNNDWIPFDLDDVSLTGLSRGSVTPFKPREGVSNEEKIEQVRRDTIQTLRDSNAQLQKTVESLIEKVQQLQKKRAAFENPLLSRQVVAEDMVEQWLP